MRHVLSTMGPAEGARQRVIQRSVTRRVSEVITDRSRGIRRFAATAVAVLFLGLPLAACSSTSKSGSNSGGGNGSTASKHINTNGTITIGTTFAPTTLDPGTGTSGADYQYLYFIFDRLINFNEHTGALEPMLATSWNFSGPNKLELDVMLRHGVTFQDGTPFNAQAVVTYSMQYIKE
jgi:peptide/nickel transport system substrate-binding protein